MNPAERLTIRETPNTGSFLINQLNAAKDVYERVGSMPIVRKYSEDISSPFYAISRMALGNWERSICFPTVSAMCINFVQNKQVFTSRDSEGKIHPVSLFFTAALPFHGEENLRNMNGVKQDKPWFAITSGADVYYQAIMAVAQGLGVHTTAFEGFSSTKELVPMIKEGNPVALSLFNTFSMQHTYPNDQYYRRVNEQGKPEINLRSEGNPDFFSLNPARHGVAISGITTDGRFIIYNTSVPRSVAVAHQALLSPDELDQHLPQGKIGPNRAIVFGSRPIDSSSLTKHEIRNIFIPIAVVKEAERYEQMRQQTLRVHASRSIPLS